MITWTPPLVLLVVLLGCGRKDNRTINIYGSSLGVEVGSLDTDFNAMLEGEVVTSFSVNASVGRDLTIQADAIRISA